jgi:hypothetical protein
VEKDKCYQFEWTTNATLSHTTVEVRDAGSGELVSLISTFLCLEPWGDGDGGDGEKWNGVRSEKLM